MKSSRICPYCQSTNVHIVGRATQEQNMWECDDCKMLSDCAVDGGYMAGGRTYLKKQNCSSNRERLKKKKLGPNNNKIKKFIVSPYDRPPSNIEIAEKVNELIEVVQDENGLIYQELLKQEYAGNNCKFSAGFVTGDNKPGEDTIYLCLEKDDREPTTLLLRPDEAQSLAWLLTGVVWSHLLNLKYEGENG